MANGHTKIAIIGAGISGLAVSYHLHHEGATIFEASDHYAGHVHSEFVDGFTWDDGPHISFSPNAEITGSIGPVYSTSMVTSVPDCTAKLTSIFSTGQLL